jgi:hypothetical protein
MQTLRLFLPQSFFENYFPHPHLASVFCLHAQFVPHDAEQFSPHVQVPVPVAHAWQFALQLGVNESAVDSEADCVWGIRTPVAAVTIPAKTRTTSTIPIIFVLDIFNFIPPFELIMC